MNSTAAKKHGRKGIIVFSLSILLSFSFPILCRATFITLDIKVTSGINEGMITLDCEVTNNGDEAAYDVEIEADTGTKKILSTTEKMLPAGDNIRRQFKFSQTVQGSSIIVPLTITYKDINRYVFSALSYAEIKSDLSEPSLVFCKMEDVSFSQKGEFKLKIKSLDHKAHDIRVKLVAPRELTITMPLKNITVPETGTVDVLFQIENFSAIAPSTYVVLGILSENRASGLYEEAFTGKVFIVSEKKGFGFLSHPYVVWIIVGLILIYIFYQFYNRKKK